jgi:hypothetical protein
MMLRPQKSCSAVFRVFDPIWSSNYYNIVFLARVLNVVGGS